MHRSDAREAYFVIQAIGNLDIHLIDCIEGITRAQGYASDLTDNSVYYFSLIPTAAAAYYKKGSSWMAL